MSLLSLSRSPARAVSVVVLAAAALLGGCAEPGPLNSAQSTTDNFQKAKAAGIRPLAVGAFSSTEDKQPDEARYLRDTLTTELQGAGMFDAASAAVVQAQAVSADFGRTGGTVAARFIVTVGNGRVVYDRELRTSGSWASNANANRERGALYNKLVGLLFTDPGFKNAVPR